MYNVQCFQRTAAVCVCGCVRALVQQQEQSALSIARALGYEQIATVLERTTTVQAAPMQAGQELHAVAPEMMQEAYMSDDDEDGEGGMLLTLLVSTRTYCTFTRTQQSLNFSAINFRSSHLITEFFNKYFLKKLLFFRLS